MKYIVEYTEKNYQGFKHNEFDNKKLALKWIKDNRSKIYWNRIRESDPKSKLPKLIVSKSVNLDSFTKLDGHLDFYFETGMEIMGVTFQDSSKVGESNPNFDPLKPEGPHNFKNYSSYEGLHFLRTGDIIQVEDGERFLLMFDSAFAEADGNRISFYPQGFDIKEWTSLFNNSKKTKASLWTKPRNESR
jgi:hypothetical protein